MFIKPMDNSKVNIPDRQSQKSDLSAGQEPLKNAFTSDRFAYNNLL